MKKPIVLFLMVVFGLGLVFGSTASTNAEENVFTLEEVTVTADKREQNVQKVAIPVQTISGYELTENGIVDLEDALKNVSNALVSPAGEEMTVIIRGMDNDSMPGDSFSQVAVTVDGSFSNSWGVGTTGIYDMQRIEVLTGPQGTLYSRNSSGGVVNMISNDPTSEKFEASGSVEKGNYNLLNVQGMINAPVNDELAIRAAFISTVHDGYSTNGLSDADDRSMRLKLGYKPSEDFSGVLTYEYSKIGGKSQGDGYVAFEDEDDVDNPWTGKSDGDLFTSNTRTDRFYANLVWNTAIGELTFLPSYSKTFRHNIQAGWLWSDGSFGFMSQDPFAVHVTQAGEHFVSPQKEQSYELRMASHEDFFMKWIVGLYYYERTWRDKIFHKDVWGPAGLTASTEDTAIWGIRNNPSWAAFTNITYPLVETFRVTLGGRYTEDKENITGASGPPGSGGPIVTNRYKSDHFDYKLGLEYDLGENSMLWIDHSTGYKHVMANRASQELKSYQVGIKNRFMNNRLQLNATAFYYDYSNFDIGRVNSEYDYDEEGNVYEYSGQGIGDANLYGLDVSSDLILSEADRLNLSLSYLSAEVDEVVITYSYQGVESPKFPPDIVDKGKTLNNAPEWSIVGQYEHRFTLPGGNSITPNVSVHYTSKYFCEFYPNARDVPPGMDAEKANTEPGHYMADASLNFRHSSGKWNINAYVKNITNHAEKNGFMRGDLRLAPPRTWGAVLSVRY